MSRRRPIRQTFDPARPSAPIPVAGLDPQPEPASADPLARFVLAMMTPLITAAGLPPDRAAVAARQALSSYSGNALQNAQAAAFAMAALDSLRLSAAEGLPLAMKLRLRGNANALSRFSQCHTTSTPVARAAARPSPTPRPEFGLGRDAPVVAELHRIRARLMGMPRPTDHQRAQERTFAILLIEQALQRVPELLRLQPHDRDDLRLRLIAATGAAAEVLASDRSDPPVPRAT